MAVQAIRKDQINLWKETPLFSEEDLIQINLKKTPKHIAFIPDGNRRWARKNRIFPEEGHRIGADVLLNIIEASHQLKIETLTFFIFSTENWSRPKKEIKAQLWLLKRLLIEQRQCMIDNGVCFKTIGDLSKFPGHILKEIDETVSSTKHCSNITVVFAINYGGRDDIIRAVKKIIRDVECQVVRGNEISEDLFTKYLDTAEWKDPDLLIRTSGESRISNFLLWQISYAEIYLSDVFWPEFSPWHLLKAVIDFQNRERRLGGS